MNDSTAMATTPGAISRPHLADADRLVEPFEAYLQTEVEAGQIAADTAQTYRTGPRKFAVWWVQAAPGPISGPVVKLWLSHLRTTGASASSLAVWFAGLRVFCRWALSTGVIAIDPTEGIKGGRRTGASSAHRRDLFTNTEMKRLLALPLSPRDRCLICLLAFTGCRGIELQRANIEDFGTIEGCLVLRVQGKGRLSADEKIVVKSDLAVEAVYSYLALRKASTGALFVSESNRTAGARLSRRALRGIIKGLLCSAGIVDSRKSTHSFRHTAISSAIRHGAPISDVKDMARHGSLATTTRYVHNLKRVERAAEAYIHYDD